MFTPILPGSSLASWNYLQNTRAEQTELFGRDALLAREQAEFKSKIVGIKSVEDLMSDYQMLKVALGAHGLKDDLPNRYFVQQVIEGGTESEDAFVNRLSDSRYASLASTFEELGLTGSGDLSLSSGGASAELITAINDKFGTSPLYWQTGGDLEGDLELAFLGLGGTDKIWSNALQNDGLYGTLTTMLGLADGFSGLRESGQIDLVKGATEYLFGSSSLSALTDPANAFAAADAYLGTTGKTLEEGFGYTDLSNRLATIFASDTDDPDQWSALQADTALRDVVAEAFGVSAGLDAMDTADQITALQTGAESFFGRSEFDVFASQANVTEIGDRYLQPAGTSLTEAFTLGAFQDEVTIARIKEPTVDEYWTAALASTDFRDALIEAYGLDSSVAASSTEDQITAFKAATQALFGSESVAIFENATVMAELTGLVMDARVNDITEDYVDQEFRLAIGELRPELRVALSVAEELETAIATGGTENGQWYRVLGSSVLRETFQTAFSLGDSFAQLELDAQVSTLKSASEGLIGSSDVASFQSAENQEALIIRYLTLAGTTQNTVASPTVSLFGQASAQSILQSLYS